MKVELLDKPESMLTFELRSALYGRSAEKLAGAVAGLTPAERGRLREALDAADQSGHATEPD